MGVALWFLSFGNPAEGFWLIILSCIVYGMAFDFFNVSGSMFVDTTVEKKYRSSGQGIFMMLTNGFGAILGSLVSGWAIDKFFMLKFTKANELATYLNTTSENSVFQAFLKSQNITVDTNELSQTIFSKIGRLSG